MLRPYLIADPRQPLYSIPQHVFCLTKRKTNPVATQLRRRAETRARHRRHSVLDRQPLRELVIREVRQIREASDHVIGTLWHPTPKTCPQQPIAKDVSPLAVVSL